MSDIPDWTGDAPDPDELVRWAERYGHPEGWVQKAQQLHGENERLRGVLGRIADKAKYLSEPAWTPDGCALVGRQIYRWAADALSRSQTGQRETP